MKAKSGALKKTKRAVVVMAAIVAISGVFVVSQKSVSAAYAETEATLQDIYTYYSYEGNIEAINSQTVYSTTMYPIKTLSVSEGDMVTEGQLLFTLDNANASSNATQAKASVNAAQLAINDAEIAYQRMQNLYNEGAISSSDFEKTQSSLSNAKIQMTQAQANYQTAANQQSDLHEYAQVTGEVIAIHVEENESMATGTKILEIVNYSGLEVNIKVDEYDIAHVREGMKADVFVNAFGESTVGTITKVSKKAEVVNGISYFPATITIDDVGDLRVGMSTEIQILSDYVENVISVPVSAVQYDEKNQAYIDYKDEKGNAVPQAVQLGLSDGQSVEIKSGIEAGQSIILPEIDDNGMLGPGML